MAMDLFDGLLGQSLVGNYCNMCHSHYCMHTMHGMAAQQQLPNYYRDLISIGSTGTITNASPVTKNGSESTSNKKLLLLLE